MTAAQQPVVSVELDQDAGAAYVRVSAGHVARTVEFTEDLNIDLDQHGVVVGIELLDLARAIPLDDIAERYHIRTEALRTLLRVFGPESSPDDRCWEHRIQATALRRHPFGLSLTLQIFD